MQRGITPKWRPSLGLVLGCTIAVVLCLPVLGICAVLWLTPEMSYWQAVLLVGLSVLLVASFVGWVLWRILLRPIRTLAARADGIRTGQGADGPLAHYGTAEMRVLGQAMLDMGETLESRAVILRSYADHVTHELKSPLTAIQGAAELLSGDLPAAERARLLTNVNNAVGRMAALLDAQRALARAQEPMPQGRTRLADLALPSGAEIVADATMPLSTQVLELVLGHLIGNALVHGATKVQLHATQHLLRVSDNGPGISKGNRGRVFDPFFTTRRTNGGTGMGLPIVRRLLEVQGARIILADDPGAVFEITF